MAITKIANARNCMKTIRYVKGSEKNPRTHFEGGRFVDAQHAQEQFLEHIRAHGRLDNVHTYNVKLSFAEDIDLTDDVQKEKLRDMLDDYCAEAFPERMVYYGVHDDGVGRKTHAHLIVSNVDLDGRCARGDDMSWTRLAPITDVVCKRHGYQTLDYDKNGLHYVDDYHERRVMSLRDSDIVGERLSPTEKMMKSQGRANESYKEHVRECAADALANEDVQSLDDFKEYMNTVHEIEVREGKRDLEYAMVWKNKEKSITARKLGDDFKKENIDEYTRQNQQQATERGLDALDFTAINSTLQQLRDDREREEERREEQRKRDAEAALREQQRARDRAESFKRRQQELERKQRANAQSRKQHRTITKGDDGLSF